MPKPAPIPPVATEKSTIKETKELVTTVKNQIAEYEKGLRTQQQQADETARQSRIALLDQKVQKLMYGDPDQRGSEQEAFMSVAEEAARTSGGKSYENLKSTYQDLVRLCLALCYVLAAFFRVEHRIAGGLSGISNIARQVIGAVSRLSGTTVELHEDMLKASQCDKDGKVTCEALPQSLFSKGTPPDMIKTLSNANEFLVTAFLMHHGYEFNDKDEYRRKKVDGSWEKLTSTKFETLKNDPDTGLKWFAEKHLPVRLTSNAMGPTGKRVPDPEPLTPSSPTPTPTPTPTTPTPRPGS